MPMELAITRRSLLVCAGGAFAMAGAARAQAGVRRIGYLSLETPGSDSAATQQNLLREALRRYGLEEGRTLAITWRYAAGRTERLDALSEELVGAGVEVIVAAFNQSIAAAARATRSLPIVMMGALVPVELGWAASLARPQGNLTGTVYVSPQTTGKLLQTLQEVMPPRGRVAVIGNPSVPGARFFGAMQASAAAALGMTLQGFGAEHPHEVAAALDRIAAWQPDALYISGDSVINPRMAEIAAFSRERRLVSIGTALVHVRQGALLYYGPQFGELVDRVALYVSRILAGAAAGELPIEQPSRYELVVNLATARELGLRLPQSLRNRADRFIGE